MDNYFQRDRVSVRMGKGTSRAWLYVKIKTTTPEGCNCKAYVLSNGCSACRKEDDFLKEEFWGICGGSNLEFETFDSFDGEGPEMPCVTVDVVRYTPALLSNT